LTVTAIRGNIWGHFGKQFPRRCPQPHREVSNTPDGLADYKISGLSPENLSGCMTSTASTSRSPRQAGPIGDGSTATLPSDTEQILHPSKVAHALELFNIHLAFARTGLLRSWKTDREITSRNLVAASGAIKDYDAIAEIEVDGCTRSIGIEYERSVYNFDLNLDNRRQFGLRPKLGYTMRPRARLVYGVIAQTSTPVVAAPLVTAPTNQRPNGIAYARYDKPGVAGDWITVTVKVP
jgi:hypothetical protein